MSRRLNSCVSIAMLVALSATAGIAKDRVRVVNEGGIRDEWMLADGIQLAAPGYPAAFAERGDNVCVAIGYAINPDGSTADFALLKHWSSSTGEKEPAAGFWDAFSQSGAGALSQWRFKPRVGVNDPQRTYTVATMHFIGKEAVDPAALRGHCTIADLAAFLQEHKAKQFYGSREKHDGDTMRRQIDAAQAKAAAARAAGWANGGN